MSKQSRCFVVALALSATLVVSPVVAAGAPMASMEAEAPVAGFLWQGFYAGLNAGYVWGNADLDVTHLPNQAAFGADPFSASLDTDGFIGGAQAGFNWQVDNFVFGVEADIQGSNASESTTFGPLPLFGGAPQAGSFASIESELNALGTVRGRVGIASGMNLFYATGGLAYGDIKDRSRIQYNGGVGNQFNYIATSNSWELGWTVGAGYERALNNNWTVKAEYLYYDLGDHSVVGLPQAPNGPFATVNDWSVTGSIVRLGVNRLF